MSFQYPSTGTQMTLAEYHALPETNKICELVVGQLFMPPTPRDTHQRITMRVFRHLSNIVQSGELWQILTGLGLDDENFYEPDVFWISDHNITCTLGNDGYYHGTPELVVEVISTDSARHDRVIKFLVYEKHNVPEYWVIEPTTPRIEVWMHDGKEFTYQGNYSSGKTFTSRVLGTEINVDKLLNG